MLLIRGKHISGDRLGRTIGFPTVNLAIEDSFDLEHGVHAGLVFHQGKKYPVWVHFGSRPTVGSEIPTFELFFLGFPEGLSDSIEVQILGKIRDIERFDSLQDLALQIDKDIVFARNHFFSFYL